MSRSPTSGVESNDLQNRHPPARGDLYGADNDHIIARDSTIPHRPGGVVSDDRDGMLHKYTTPSA